MGVRLYLREPVFLPIEYVYFILFKLCGLIIRRLL